jgi:hypothetical protein
VTRAREEGVSLNKLVITILAESLAAETRVGRKRRTVRRDDSSENN